MNYNKLTSTLKANGTSLQGYVNTTFEHLENILGEPIYPDSGDGKVVCEWVLEFEDGTIATIYCWKLKTAPTTEYNWHIGGVSEKAVKYVEEILKQTK
jgi:DNA gyrase/topoisomerase IV subunit B